MYMAVQKDTSKTMDDFWGFLQVILWGKQRLKPLFPCSRLSVNNESPSKIQAPFQEKSEFAIFDMLFQPDGQIRQNMIKTRGNLN